VGPGAVVALTYRATVDQPQRFVHSRAVGAHVGLTPKRHQSGEVDYDGRVSKCGDTLLRTMLYEAAQVLLTHGSKWSWLKAWGIRVAQRRGMRRAIVAVARRLAVVLHRMWVDGSEFRWSKNSTAVPAADQRSGRDWAVLKSDGSLAGHIFFHNGDDSGFTCDPR
jgi:transposase